jgi:Domain of unknown function (DUF5680)
VQGLEAFVVDAKAACYVGGGRSSHPSRAGSHDLRHATGEWSYLDSYFGGSDFLGQEVVWHRDVPVWAMNYYGKIVDPTAINAQAAGDVIKAALTALYREGRFLGGFRFQSGDYLYLDATEGSVSSFTGEEIIQCNNQIVYRLCYHGGLVQP